jgi:DNA-directed RNA polymerase specialized sigma24 family protein
MLGAVPQLRAFAMKLCRNVDQADDLVQETIARGCKNIALFEPGTMGGRRVPAALNQKRKMSWTT